MRQLLDPIPLHAGAIMRDRKKQLAAVLLGLMVAFSGKLAAQQEPEFMGSAPWVGDLLTRMNYFPLETGNQWVYSDGRNSYAVEVTQETTESNGRTYYQITGFFQNDPAKVRKLRRDYLGQVWEYNPRGEDFLWYRLSGVMVAAWEFQSGQEISCVTGSSLSARSTGDPIQVAAGNFSRIIRVEFKSRCADGGILEDYFAPGMGLIKRVNNSIAGPRNFELISARVGSQLFPQSVYGAQISIDKPVYFNNRMPPVSNPAPTLIAQLSLHNDSDTPVELAFSSSQRYEWVIRDRVGKELWRWSEGLGFLQVLGQETLAKGRPLNYSVSIKLASRNGTLLDAGFYTLEGYLTTIEVQKGMQPLGASIRFELQDLH
jgi:hypothetical protein